MHRNCNKNSKILLTILVDFQCFATQHASSKHTHPNKIHRLQQRHNRMSRQSNKLASNARRLTYIQKKITEKINIIIIMSTGFGCSDRRARETCAVRGNACSTRWKELRSVHAAMRGQQGQGHVTSSRSDVSARRERGYNVTYGVKSSVS